MTPRPGRPKVTKLRLLALVASVALLGFGYVVGTSSLNSVDADSRIPRERPVRPPKPPKPTCGVRRLPACKPATTAPTTTTAPATTAPPPTTTAPPPTTTVVEPPPPLADLYMAADGDDTGPCSIDVPCRTMNYACEVAKGGETVAVREGLYPGQGLTCAGKPDFVTFRPATGARPCPIEGTSANCLRVGPATTASAERIVYQDGPFVDIPVGSDDAFVVNTNTEISAAGAITFYCQRRENGMFIGCYAQGGAGCTVANGGCRIFAGMNIHQGGIGIGGNETSKLVFHDFTANGVGVVDYTSATPGASEIEFHNVRARTFGAAGCVSQVGLYDSNIGPSLNAHSTLSVYNEGCAPDRTKIYRNVFHDVRAYQPQVNADIHTECFQGRGGTNTEIISNVFTFCDATGSLVVGSEAAVFSGRIENNMIDSKGSSHFGFYVNGNPVIVRNNTSLKPIYFTCPIESCKAEITGNYAPSIFCGQTGATYSKNTWTSGRCEGDNPPVAALEVIDPVSPWPALNLRLTPGSNAIDQGDPDSYPLFDFDGIARYRGTAPDVGCCEGG